MSEAKNTTGFGGLLNWPVSGHKTFVFTDVPGTEELITDMCNQISEIPTKVTMIRLNGDIIDIGEKVLDLGLKPKQDYASFIAIVAKHRSFEILRSYFKTLHRGDFCRIELPFEGSRAPAESLHHLLSIIRMADYGQQDIISNRFFDLLESKPPPYSIDINTPGASLEVCDVVPWFQLAGRLTDGEVRILPGGEVAYTGSAINGTFCVDGAVLAIPETPDALPLALELGNLSSLVERNPLLLEIKDGIISSVSGHSSVSNRFKQLLLSEAYRNVTEVGISFNEACNSFIHSWPCAGNEGRPGVHIGIGGDPDPESNSEIPHVHVDLMCRHAQVIVNDLHFLSVS